MLLKIALNNIGQKRLRSLLATLSITIACASLLLFTGLSAGIKNATFDELEKASPLNQITVRPSTKDTGIVSFLTKSDKGKISEETVTQLSKLPNVKNIHREIQFKNFSSLEINLLGLSLQTDTMVFGLPQDFIQADIKSTSNWQNPQEPYPALIPRRLLDLYNVTIASTQNLPKISEEKLLGKEILLYPNRSTFFPFASGKSQPLPLEIAGFSDKINLLGVTLPYSTVEDLNQEFFPGTTPTYTELYVETTDASVTAATAKAIEALGFSTQYYQKNLADIEAKLTYLSLSLGIISAIIILTAAISIISTFLGTIAERRREIGLLRALGATRYHIKKLILLEAGLIGISGAVLGTAIGLISSHFLSQYALSKLTDTTLNLSSLFNFTPQLIIQTLLFGLILALLSAYLPASQASKLSPIEALTK